MASEPADMLNQPRTVPAWVRVSLVNVAAALLVVLAFSHVTWRTPWNQLLGAFAIAYLISTCIGVPCAYVIPRVSRAITGRVPFPYTWIIFIAVMIGLAVIGSMAALAVMWATGYIPSAHFRDWLGGSLKIAIIITLVFGIFTTLIEISRSRLSAATLALRTKERDEAEARRLASEAQLASLEARVNPHFLFNTLNSIAALVRDDPAAAERMTGQLAALMRSSLCQQTSLVPLDDELRMVRAYLDIEQVRFGDRLDYRFDIASDAGAALVPRLSVQTLVENSIKYAVSLRREPTTIVVRAARDNGRLRLEVHDNGSGFPASQPADGHGLALLTSRLAMSFGDRATLTIESRQGDTTVIIELPA
ncbi:MAG TPA: histidine kinase [Vicinamibacterales bacterium]|nr:histidine kinase [Vicinamibacterales bacterium]